MTDQEMVAALEAKGFTILPPVDPRAAIPKPEVGQVWWSPKVGVEPRTVVAIGPARGWDRDVAAVSFTTPSRQPHPQWGPSVLPPWTWREWARKSGARPA